MITLNRQIKSIRKMRHLTLKQVHEGTGLSISYLSDLERGVTRPSLETLERLAEFHGCDIVITFVGTMAAAK